MHLLNNSLYNKIMSEMQLPIEYKKVQYCIWEEDFAKYKRRHELSRSYSSLVLCCSPTI